MNCREFEKIWSDRHDVREWSAEDDRRLDDHAHECEPCRNLHVGFQALASALAMPSAPSAPPAGFVDRTLEAFEANRPFRLRRLVPLAAAAAVVLAVGSAWLARGIERRKAVLASAPSFPAELKSAMRGAAAVTWDLAREARGDADETAVAGEETASIPEFTLPVAVSPSADVLRSLGDRLNAGAVPLEGTARQAFGFLLGPAEPTSSSRSRPRDGA